MNSRILASLLAAAVVASICVTAAGEAKVSSCGISADWLPLLARPGWRGAVSAPAPFSRFTAVAAGGCTARASSRRLRELRRLRRRRGLLGALLTFLPRSEQLAAARLVREPLLEEAARRCGLRLRRRLADRPIARGALPGQEKGGVETLAVKYV